MRRLTEEIAYSRRLTVAQQELAHCQGGLHYARKYIDDEATLHFWMRRVGAALDQLWAIMQTAPYYGETVKRAA